MRLSKVSGSLSALVLVWGAMAFAACGDSLGTDPGDASADGAPTSTTTGTTTATGTTPVPDAATTDAASPDAGPKDATSDGSLDATSDADTDAATDAGADATVDASDTGPVVPPAVRFVGRWDTRSAAGPRVAYPGARIVARFQGTEVSVTLDNTTGFAGGPSRYDVLIDGVLEPTQLVTQVGQVTYPLASGLAAGTHTVELLKRTEGNLGVTTFMGFDFGAGGALLAPPPTPTRRIEIISDSTIDGYGIEGMGPVCPAGTLEASHSARLGLAGLLASDLGADAHMIGYSGKGLTRNSYLPDTATMGVLYPRALPDDATSLWDFTTWTPDVVVISIGGTDFNAGVPNIATLSTKYDELVQMVRTYAPDAHIFMTIYAQLKDSYPVGYNVRTNLRTAIQNVIAANPADTKLHLYQMTESVPSQETGCQYHGNLALHRTLATAFVPVIRAATGW
ncbi:MAG: GDSL-type esterase/lipase family protein [Polyangiaceae bacterium]